MREAEILAALLAWLVLLLVSPLLSRLLSLPPLGLLPLTAWDRDLQAYHRQQTLHQTVI